ncbi:MAG: transketolase family protein [Ruminococcaceae bacterium]|nr:transketolase family protein [Oscillospiraceae bacterium]
MEKIATRTAYGNALKDLGNKYNFYVMDADLSSSTQTAVFGKSFPERFANCGIAEGNMASVAAGIASTGVPVFISSFAMFATGRAFEQIRNSIAYPKLNVKVCASHAGVSVGEDGATHQCVEDISLMRSIPGMTVIVPADATEAYAAVEAIMNYNGPVYLRLARLATPVLFEKDNYKFEFGKAVALKEGKDTTIFATGMMVSESLEAAKILEKHGIDASVINIHTIKPIDREAVVKHSDGKKRIFTVEEHSIIGGLGDAVSEVIVSESPRFITKIGINDVFGESGKALEVLEKHGLCAEKIAERIIAELKG